MLSPPCRLALCLNDDVAEVRLSVIEELGHLGPLAKDALRPLREVERLDNRPAVRQAAAEAIKKIMGE